MIVTHVPPWVNRDEQVAEAAAAYGAPVEVATPGATFTV